MASTPKHAAGAHAAPETPRVGESRHIAPSAGVSTRPVSARTARAMSSVAPRTRAERERAARGTNGGAPRRHAAAFVAAVIALGIVVVAVVAFVVLPRFASSSSATVEPGLPVTIEIPEGSGATAIAKILKEAGVISDTSAFSEEVGNQGASQKLKAGVYDFTTGQAVSEVVAQLVKGPNSTTGKVVIAEGLTVAKIASVVGASSAGVSAADFAAQAKVSNYVADYPFLSEAKNDSLEGFLYPATYDVTGKQVSADSIIRDMLDQYKAQVVDKLDIAGAKESLKARYGRDFTTYELLTLASIIEKEAINSTDRPLVASVFYNRLQANSALQSDATMGYVTGGAVTPDDLKQDNPYNTYYYKGLPPTPICSPGAESIKAALAPADTSYFYFLIIEKGSYSNHTFSVTYEEHQQAIAQAQADETALGITS